MIVCEGTKTGRGRNASRTDNWVHVLRAGKQPERIRATSETYLYESAGQQRELLVATVSLISGLADVVAVVLCVPGGSRRLIDVGRESEAVLLLDR